jgi:hypothetical protein
MVTMAAAKVQIEVDDCGVAVGAAADFAEAVHPGIGPLDGPAFAGLDWGGYAFAGDLGVEAEFVEQVADALAVVAAIQMRGAVTWCGQWCRSWVLQASKVSRSSGESCRLAPAPVMPSGMP